MNNKREVEKENELKKKIEELIMSSDLNYKQVYSVLSYLIVVYMDKGKNLLNSVKIQKVLETPRFTYQNKN